MIILLFLALSLSSPLPSELLNNTSNFAIGFHLKCDDLLPQTSASHHSLAALICGANLPVSALQNDLLRSSLIHAYVVSGSHLLLLDQFFSIFKIPGLVRFLFLSFYSLIAGWQAPVVRALLSWIFTATKFRMRLSIPSDLLVAIAGMTCLVLFPAWWSSLSLILSWCASLALSAVGLFRIRKTFPRILATQLCIFVFMSFPLWGWGNLHPLSVLFNLTLMPFISLILFPTAILGFLFPPTLFLFEHSESLFRWILEHGTEPIQLVRSSSLPPAYSWMWITAWHVVIHFFRIHTRQGRDRR